MRSLRENWSTLSGLLLQWKEVLHDAQTSKYPSGRAGFRILVI